MQRFSILCFVIWILGFIWYLLFVIWNLQELSFGFVTWDVTFSADTGLVTVGRYQFGFTPPVDHVLTEAP